MCKLQLTKNTTTSARQYYQYPANMTNTSPTSYTHEARMGLEIGTQHIKLDLHLSRLIT